MSGFYKKVAVSGSSSDTSTRCNTSAQINLKNIFQDMAKGLKMLNKKFRYLKHKIRKMHENKWSDMPNTRPNKPTKKNFDFVNCRQQVRKSVPLSPTQGTKPGYMRRPQYPPYSGNNLYSTDNQYCNQYPYEHGSPRTNRNKPALSNVQCYRCTGYGHLARECRTVCFHCNGYGHFARNCTMNGPKIGNWRGSRMMEPPRSSNSFLEIPEAASIQHYHGFRGCQRSHSDYFWEQPGDLYPVYDSYTDLPYPQSGFHEGSPAYSGMGVEEDRPPGVPVYYSPHFIQNRQHLAEQIDEPNMVSKTDNTHFEQISNSSSNNRFRTFDSSTDDTSYESGREYEEDDKHETVLGSETIRNEVDTVESERMRLGSDWLVKPLDHTQFCMHKSEKVTSQNMYEPTVRQNIQGLSIFAMLLATHQPRLRFLETSIGKVTDACEETKWEPEHQTALMQIRKALASSNVVQLPVIDHSYILRVEIIEDEIQCLLTQKRTPTADYPMREAIIAYESRDFATNSTNSAFLQIYGITLAIAGFRQYLRCADFYVISDNSESMKLLRAHVCQHRNIPKNVKKLIEEIRSYSFTIKHVDREDLLNPVDLSSCEVFNEEDEMTPIQSEDRVRHEKENCCLHILKQSHPHGALGSKHSQRPCIPEPEAEDEVAPKAGQINQVVLDDLSMSSDHEDSSDHTKEVPVKTGMFDKKSQHGFKFKFKYMSLSKIFRGSS